MFPARSVEADSSDGLQTSRRKKAEPLGSALIRSYSYYAISVW